MSGPAILVVDDNPVKRIALRAMLAPLGYAVVEADSGRAALEALAHQTFALILMDVRMPTLNGFETAKLCRQQSRGARTPIIFVTAEGGDRGRRPARTRAAPSTSSSRRCSRMCCGPRSRRSSTCSCSPRSCRARSSRSPSLNAALRDSDIRTQAVLDNVSDGIFILDEKRRHRIGQPVRGPAVRLPRRGAGGTSVRVHDRARAPRRVPRPRCRAGAMSR